MEDKTQVLISEMHKRDRRFRRAQAVFNTILLTSVLAVLVVGVINLSNLKTGVADLKQQSEDQLKKANDHIDCIALFFAESDRVNKTLDDLQGCDIVPIQPSSSQSSATSSAPVSTPAQQRTPSVQSSSPSNSSSTPQPNTGALQKVGQTLDNAASAVTKAIGDIL